VRASQCGRADLVRAMLRRGSGGLDAMARLLGYEPQPAPPPGDHEELLAAPSPPPETGEIRLESAAPRSVPFWRLEAWEESPQEAEQPVGGRNLTDSRPESAIQTQPDDGLVPEPVQPAVFAPLATWRKLVPRLRRVAGRQAWTAELDVNAIVRRLSQGTSLVALPRRRRLRWGPRIQLIVDRSQRLIPYWQDQDLVWERLRRLYPRHAFEAAWISDGMEEPVFARGRRGGRRYETPPPGTLVLVLGDLGCLDHGGEEARRCWTQLARRFAERDLRYVALVPCPRQRVGDPPEKDRGTIVCWESPARTGSGRRLHRQELAVRAHRLLTLLSPAIRVEPGLMRAVRLLLGMADADAGTEADVWQHPWIIGRSSVAATLNPEHARTLLREFETLPEGLQRQTLDLIRRWRQGLRPEVWYEEVLALGHASQQHLPANEVTAAKEFFIDLASRWQTTELPASETSRKAWFHRVQRRLPEHVWQQHGVGRALYRMWWFACGDDPHAALPPGWELREIPKDALQYKLERWSIRQVGKRLHFAAGTATSSATPSSLDSAPSAGSLLGEVHVRRPLIHVAAQDDRTFWKSGRAPAWAVDWGQDSFGVWVEFEVGGVRQRMRWIEPGVFQMGSPDDEPGRYGGGVVGGIWNEGPQHQVTITRGFWLFDTPCTQALWQAVMGDNSSRFRSPDRPVEQVAWEDCQKFLERINELAPGLDLTLPTEAQWEYACRSGTDTATYDGSLEIVGECNAPALDSIAWYAGNSGRDFELDNGEDSTGWPNKQYDHRRAGSHPVRRRKPNAWGLYDMLGNVWEWCHDGLRTYASQAVTDPVGPTGRGADRVLRGGSWGSLARIVRCADRDADHPGLRDDSIGFRLARVQQSQEQASAPHVAASLRDADPVSERPAHVEASLRGAHPDLPGAELVRLAGTASAECPLPPARAMVIATDCEKLTFQQINRPEWASAIGRDRFGLWVEFELSGKREKPITQRMRWIPPGRFMMGSPADEPGRPTKDELERYKPHWPDEGPQHLVTITHGYWLFDTPCTQALWEAVMHDNPSRFKSPDRPVEQVSWEDCRKFFAEINGVFKGLDLSLPTEAQWEYACRAGTDAATCAGPLDIVGECNAPALDPIAWYSGNSGVDFELDSGEDSSNWPNKQYDHQRAGTRPVAQKLANPWGLYDMLGNVWEWCLDRPRPYTDQPADDPVDLATDPGAARVLRGGGWLSDARNVRCALRFADLPGHHFDSFGFRPARVQQSQQQAGLGAPAAELAGPALGRKGAARPTQDQPSGAPSRKKRQRRK
jgi:formylglycine-generating enzyme required for sulfatase activity